MKSLCFDGEPCEGKLSCTVWTGGKSGDNIKGLPIGINLEQTHYIGACLWNIGGRCKPDHSDVRRLFHLSYATLWAGLFPALPRRPERKVRIAWILSLQI